MASSKSRSPKKTDSPAPANSLEGFEAFRLKVAAKLLDIKKFPSWLRSRPAAFTTWRRAERKKKKYRSFRLQKRIAPEPRYVPSSWLLFKQSLRFLGQHIWIFLGIMAVYGAIYFLLVWSPGSLDVATLQETIEGALGTSANDPVTTAAVIGAVLGTPRQAGSSPLLNGFLLVTISLVVIFAIRELTNGQTLKIRDAYYRGLGPLVPVICILLVISLQLIPLAIASFVYATARTGGLFVSGVEDLSFFLVTLLIGVFSLYFITSSVLSLYAATLPGMYPVAALRSAKKLVQFRRLAVFKRFITLPLALLALYLLILLLAIRFIPNQTFIVMDVYAIAIIPLIHTYLYKLYRSLI